MRRDRRMQTIVLTLVGIALAAAAVLTSWPDWLIAVLFVGAALAAYLARPDKPTDE